MKFAPAGAVTAIAVAFGMAAPAAATEGYFALGFGPTQRGVAGAGVANPTDAMSATLNPAAAAHVGRQFQLGIEVFSPRRGFTATGTGFVPPGETRSDENFFFVPNLSYNMPLDNGAALNLSVYGNGGMNTTYPDVANPNCGPFSGVFCGGKAGVDLSQLFISATYAKKIGNFSFGIAPTIVAQRFAAEGLLPFGFLSVDPTALSNNGFDWSFGYGLRAGMQVAVSDTLRFGVSGQTKMLMSEFDKYAGLFADGGDFDIPASVTLGVAWDARPDLTLMFDAKRIFYSGVDAVANPFGAGPLGAAGGTGFGWDDVDVFKVGAEWRQNDRMTWRAGYGYASNPIGANDVTLNILAPGIVQHHITAGGSLRLNDRDALDFAVIYVPESTVSGPEVTPGGPTPGSNIQLEMNQFAISVGWTREF